MKIIPHIFREYDIRGLAETELTPECAYHLGRAVGSYVRRGGGRTVVVGRDCRPSGVVLEAKVVEGLRASGCGAICIGMVPTPVGYWAIQHLGVDGGIQITGSHNPPAYNGFKLTLLGESLSGVHIQSIGACMAAEDYTQGQADGDGCAEGDADRQHACILDAYLNDLVAHLYPAQRPMTVVVDAGNGMAGITVVPLFRRLGYTVIPLFCEPDGRFPNHPADPAMEENLVDIRRTVLDEKADLGMAFDGDGDRLCVIDRDGTVIWGDRLMIVLARAVLKEAPGASIIAEVKCSQTLFDAIAKAGGVPIMWRAGHSLIKAKMKECGAALAGEMSGHIFYQHRYYGFDDATYAGARLLEVMGAQGPVQADESVKTRLHGRDDVVFPSIGDMLADIPVMFATPEIRVSCAEDRKQAVIDYVRTECHKLAPISPLEGVGAAVAPNSSSEKVMAQDALPRIIAIDGVRVQWSDGWGLVRPSHTQPLLIVRCEAKTAARLYAIQEWLRGMLAHEGLRMTVHTPGGSTTPLIP